jgi:hypothetical protein
VTVLIGLVECEERRTLTSLRRKAGDKPSLSGLSRFMGRWPWSAEQLSQIWLDHFRRDLAPQVITEHARQRTLRPLAVGRPKPTVVTGYLSLDDSVHYKPKGKKMGGLGKHYSGCEKKS